MSSVLISGAQTDNVVIVGKSVQLSATPRDVSGNPLTDRPVTWTSSNAATATVSATGLVTALTAGSSTITAAAEGVSSAVLMSLRVEFATPAGGQTTTTQALGGLVAVTIPPSAVPAGVTLNVAPAAAPPADAGLVEAFDFGPSGTQFSTPITITLKYDKSLVTSAQDRAGLAIYLAQGSSWLPVAGSTVDTAAGTVSALVSHFSTYGVLRPAPAATLAVQAGNSQSAASGASVAVPPAVAVTDTRGALKAGVTVTFAVTSGGGSVSGSAQTTDAHGVATVGGWVLGPATGANTLTATVSGLTPVTFTATGIAPSLALAPATLAFTANVGEADPLAKTVNVGSNGAQIGGLGLGTITYTGSASGWLSASLNGATTPATISVAVSSGGLSAGTTYSGLIPVTAANGTSTQNIVVTLQVAVSSAAALAVTRQPTSATSGLALQSQPVVEIRTASGQRLAGATQAVTAAIASGDATLAGTTTMNAVDGVATFTDLVVTGVGPVTLQFAAATVPVVTSASFSVTQVPASLAITRPLSDATAGQPFGVQPIVEIRDNGGRRIASSTASVSAAVSMTSNGASLTGGISVNAVAGIATFASLEMDGLPGPYALVFRSGSLSVNSASFALAPGIGIGLSPASLAFQATRTGANPPSQSVTLLGATSYSVGAISYSGLSTGWLSVSLTGNILTVSAVTGALAAGSYSASVAVTGAAGINGSLSVSFTVSPLPATQLAMTTQPSASASSGAPFAVQPTLEIRDATGTKVAGASVSVTAALASGSGTLVGTTTVTAVNGVATFSNLQINGAGAFTLSFTATGLTAATSNTVTVTQTATQVVLTTQPAGASSGTVFGTQPVLEVRDGSGTKVAGSSVAVTAAIASGSGTLVGTTTMNAVNGVVTFTDLKINGLGVYTLSFTATGLTAATSGSFTVTQVPTQLALVTAPSPAAASGVVLAVQPVVEVRDAGNVKVAGSTVNVTAAIASGSATLSGTTTVAAVNGTATFTNLKLTGATGTVTVTFTSSGLTAATSGAITLTQTASQVVLTTQPAGAVSGAVLTTQPVVELRDPGNLLVANATLAVTAAIASGSGTLVGTTTVNAVNGVATFTNLQVNGTAGSYTLSFSATGLTAATSTSFTVTQVATALVLTVQPSGAQNGSVLGTQPVLEIRDGANLKVAAATNAVSVALASGSGTLSGTTTVSAVGGVVTFANLKITGTGAYTLAFSASGLTGATSNSFTVAAPVITLAVGASASTSGTNGQNLTIPIILDLTQAAGQNIASLTANVTWDPTKFDFVSASAGTSGWSITPNTSNTSTGSLVFSAFDAVGLSSGTTTMYNVTLVPKASGTTSVSASVSTAGADIGTNVLGFVTTRALTVVVP